MLQLLLSTFFRYYITHQKLPQSLHLEDFALQYFIFIGIVSYVITGLGYHSNGPITITDVCMHLLLYVHEMWLMLIDSKFQSMRASPIFCLQIGFLRCQNFSDIFTQLAYFCVNRQHYSDHLNSSSEHWILPKYSVILMQFAQFLHTQLMYVIYVHHWHLMVVVWQLYKDYVPDQFLMQFKAWDVILDNGFFVYQLYC